MHPYVVAGEQAEKERPKQGLKTVPRVAEHTCGSEATAAT